MTGLSTARHVRWLAVIGWCLIASGIPMPGIARQSDRHSPSKDRSRPFPCMDSPCGCGTAEQCFSSCCCHSPAERLAWARAHGLDVGLLTALEDLVAACPNPSDPTAERPHAARPSEGTPVDGHHGESCCGTVSPPCCESPTTKTAVGGSCAKARRQAADSTAATGVRDRGGDRAFLGRTSADDADPSRTNSGTPAPAPAGGGIVLRAMLACQGVIPGLGSGEVPLPAPAVGWQDDCAPWGAAPTIDDVATGHAARPELPPPRRVAA